MLFRSKLFAHWDTWMYYNEGKYFLYYLIFGDNSTIWDGFGVAVSTDGVYYTDYGRVIGESPDNRSYLGTGAIWKAADYDESRRFVCNYSEHRETPEGLRQHIFFATSTDLIHWEKLGNEMQFSSDEQYYRGAGGRWDCIYPLEKENGGYYGYLTASPYAFDGIGICKSEDGIHWRALPPGEVNINPHKLVNVEAGAIVRHKDTYYLMVGSEMEMLICTSKSPFGPFTLMKKNGKLFSRLQTKNGKTGHIHAYFARFFMDEQNILANFHVLPREFDEMGRCSYSYMAPLKKVQIDAEGILRMYWWEGNDSLIGEGTAAPSEAWVSDVPYYCGTELTFVLEGKNTVQFCLESNGVCRLWDQQGTEMEVDRGMALGKTAVLRVLVRDVFLEVYADGEYVCSYTAKGGIQSLKQENVDVIKRKLFLP